MPYKRVNILPGYYTEASKIDSPNRYINGDHIRFYKGFPQKIGGCVKQTTNTFLGVCRGLETWITINGDKYIGLGTNLKLYINEGGAYFDITPLRESGTLGLDPFETTIGSAIVEVTDVASGVAVGDYVSFSGATPVGGLTIDGEYTVTSIIDVDHYTITASSLASSSATGGGAAVDYEYQIHIGPVDTTELGGWGTGTWGTGTWGTPRTGTGLLSYARTWALNNFGEDLIASYQGGGIYRWLASGGLATRAAIIATAPETNARVLVSSEDRYVIALGAHNGIDDDPMLIRWCSQDDVNDWTPTTTNTAGDKRLSDGNTIITGISTRGQILISTDTTIYSMYSDSEFIFAFRTLGDGGVIGPNAMIQYNGIVYWMGKNNFYLYDGNINIMPCDVRSYVFDNLNQLQGYKVYAWINSLWNEVWWFYTDNNSTENNRYVAYNLLENYWHYGSWVRTAGIDKGLVNNNPMATGLNGQLFNHESGVDDDGVALSTLLETGNIQIEERNKYIVVKKLLPNFKTLTGTVNLKLKTWLYPQDSNPIVSQDYTVTSSTTYISTRARGDEVSIIYDNSEVGSYFNIGTLEVEYIGTGVR